MRRSWAESGELACELGAGLRDRKVQPQRVAPSAELPASGDGPGARKALGSRIVLTGCPKADLQVPQ